MKHKASLTTPLFVLVIYILLYACRFLDVTQLGTGSRFYLSVIALQMILFMIPGFFFCRIKKIGHEFPLNIRLFAPGDVGFVILSVASLIAVSTLIRCGQYYLLQTSDFSTMLFAGLPPIKGGSVSDSLYLMLAYALVPAVAEEFVFRTAVLVSYQESGCGTMTALLASTLLFTMMHFSLSSFPVVFLGGLVFGMVTYTTRSVLSAMIAHFLYNLYELFGAPYIMALIKKPENIVFFLFALITLLLLFSILTCSEAERIHRRDASIGLDTPRYVTVRAEQGRDGASERLKSAIEVFLSPTFLLCVFVFIVIALGFVRV